MSKEANSPPDPYAKVGEMVYLTEEGEETRREVTDREFAPWGRGGEWAYRLEGLSGWYFEPSLYKRSTK